MGVFQNNLMGAAAAAASAGGGDFYSHQIANSLRMSDANNTTLKITAGTPTSRKTFTYSWWWKRYNISTSTQSSNVFCAGTGGGTYVFWPFTNSSVMQANFNFTGGNFGDSRLTTNMQFRDTSAWYHCVLRFDSTQATASNRVRLYVNGVEPTYSSASVQTDIAQDEDISFMNQSGVVQSWGGISGVGTGGEGVDVQLAEIVFNDGQSYGPDSYGETKNGVWIPKDPSGLTFGDNGYYLNFASSSDLGNDVSGNNNDFTPANLSAHDQMLDSPTFNSSSNGGNYCTLNPLFPDPTVARINDGNLAWGGSAGGGSVNEMGCMSTFAISPSDTNKYYFEARMKAGSGGGNEQSVGVNVPTVDLTSDRGGRPTAWCITNSDNQRIYNGADSYTNTGVAGSAGDIVGVEIDRANTTIKFYVNGTLRGTQTNLNTTTDLYPWVGTGGSTSDTLGWDMNFGQNGTFNGLATAQGESDATGYSNFYYDEAGSCKSLCSGNLPIAAEVDPAQTDDDFPQKLFGVIKYTGNGTQRTISTPFQFDWLLSRSSVQGQDWYSFDTNRGIFGSNNYYVKLNTTAGEADLPQDNYVSQTASGSDAGGYVLSSGTWFNSGGHTQINWLWRANGGSTTTDTSGDIDGVYQTNNCGFSIMKYSGNGSNAQTVPHGVKVGGVATAPSYVMMKNLPDSSNNWRNWSIGYENGDADSYAEFNDSAWLANQGSGGLFTSKPTDTMLTLTDYSAINASGKAVIVYSFANVEGFIKSGSYVGNADDNGTFLYLGFKPAFFMCKPIVAGNWRVQDNIRSPINVAHATLFPNNNNAEETNDSNDIDFLSNGVKMRASDSNYNQATTFVYLAMAENPFKYATAR